MNILHHRPLFFCCAVFMLGAVVGYVLPAVGKGILAILLLLLSVVYVLWQRFRRGRRAQYWISVVAAVLACVALLQSHLTFHGETATHLEGLTQNQARVEGIITDRRGTGGNMTAYTLSLTAVEGVETKGLALLTCYYVSDLQPGFVVDMMATVIPLDGAAGEGYDAAILLGDGYVTGLHSEAETDVTIVREDGNTALVRVGRLRRALSKRLNLMTEDGLGIPTALLLGDRSALEDTVKRDFARAGISHLLAISGLHMTLLFGLLAVLLTRLRCPKRARAAVLGGLALGYLVLLGFPPSATRAVIMLGTVYLSHLCYARADTLTSLGMAGCLILAVTPYAVADGGFWMSFMATLGLATVMPLMGKWLDVRGITGQTPKHVFLRGMVKLVTGLGVGVVAVSFVLPIQASFMGEMGILSSVSTLLLTPLCAVVLVLSLLCLPLWGTSVGGVLSMLAETVSVVMARLAAWLGDPSWAVVSLRHPLVTVAGILMLAGVLVLLLVKLPPRRQGLVLLPILLGWVVVGSILGVHYGTTSDQVSATYLQPSTQSDALVMVCGQQGMICDLSNGSLSALSASAREAEALGATELSALMLTHYHSRTPGALSSLLSRETVRALWLPRPEDEEDYYLLLACLEQAEEVGVPAYMYGKGEELTIFGDGRITVETDSLDRSTQPVLLVSVSFAEGTESLLYYGSCVHESTLAARAAALAAEAEIVIFGNHGPIVKTAFGGDLRLPEVRQVLLSEYGNVAACFDPSAVSDKTEIWLGPCRMNLCRG